MSLSQLITPVSVVEFLRDGFPRELNVWHGGLDRIASFDLIRALGGVEAFVSEYCHNQISVWSDWKNPRLSHRPQADTTLDVPVTGPVASELFRRGATLYFRALESTIPIFREMAREIAEAVHAPASSVTVEAVAGRVGTGAPLHFDADFAWNVQVFGEKHWDYADNTHFSNPQLGYGVGRGLSDEHRRAMVSTALPVSIPEPYQTLTARPGTVIYLPRGVWHQTRVVGDVDSLAVVFAVRPQLLAEVFCQRLRDLMLRETEWRQPASGREPAALCALLERTWRNFSERYRGVSVDDMFLPLPSEIASRWQFRVPENVALRLDDRGSARCLVIERASTSGGAPTSEEVEVDEESFPLGALQWICGQSRPFSAAELCRVLPAARPPELATTVGAILETLISMEIVERLEAGQGPSAGRSDRGTM